MTMASWSIRSRSLLPTWGFLGALLASAQAKEYVCSAATGGKDCLSSNMTDRSCTERGFDSARLTCKTCRMLGKRLEEMGVNTPGVVDECLACCQDLGTVERFSTARLIADASQQERDQDLHDFIKRKAPRYKGLEVEYQEGADPAIELESDTDPDRVLRAVVAGWKSDHLGQFLELRLEGAENVTSSAGYVENAGSEGEVTMAAEGAWTAEVQTCSG